jgi:hypothetical protein
VARANNAAVMSENRTSSTNCTGAFAPRRIRQLGFDLYGDAFCLDCKN